MRERLILAALALFWAAGCARESLSSDSLDAGTPAENSAFYCFSWTTSTSEKVAPELRGIPLSSCSASKEDCEKWIEDSRLFNGGTGYTQCSPQKQAACFSQTYVNAITADVGSNCFANLIDCNTIREYREENMWNDVVNNLCQAVTLEQKLRFEKRNSVLDRRSSTEDVKCRDAISQGVSNPNHDWGPFEGVTHICAIAKKTEESLSIAKTQTCVDAAFPREVKEYYAKLIDLLTEVNKVTKLIACDPEMKRCSRFNDYQDRRDCRRSVANKYYGVLSTYRNSDALIHLLLIY